MLERFQLCDDLDECLDQLKDDRNRDMAVAVSRERLRNSPLILNKEIFCLPSSERIHKFSVALVLTEHRPEVDEIFGRIIEAGFVQKWRGTKAYRRRIKQIRELKVLSISETGSAFMVVAIGWTVALLTFMAELISKRKMKRADCHPFWRFMAKTVDGRRFYFVEKID